MKRQFLFHICITVLLLAGSWLAGPALADSGWNIQTVDSAGNIGYYTSLALDAGGNAHISYCDGTNGDLKYAAWNGSSWNIETVDWEGSVGAHSSLALDSSGYPHISYYKRYAGGPGTYADLKYARLERVELGRTDGGQRKHYGLSLVPGAGQQRQPPHCSLPVLAAWQ